MLRQASRSPNLAPTVEVDIVVPYNSVPLVYKNVVVVGANNPPGSGGAVGNARAFDARTGAKLWEFSSVAQPGSVGHDTWEGDSWKGRFGANAWPFYFTLDEQRGLLYLPLASPIPGGYGGDRAGANLYGNSVVAVDVQTGAYKWHFQTIHHDMWDADPPAPPGLIDIVRDGRRIPAMALTTKSGYMYILNRETGQPIFGVVERPMPKSDVPGERAFPTQPIPVKPPALARVAYGPAGSRHRRRYDSGTCSRVPGTDREKRRRPQRGAVHAVEVSGAGSDDADFPRLPGRTGWTELGWNGVGRRVRICFRRDAGRRRAWLRPTGARRRTRCLRKSDAGTRDVRRARWRSKLALPEAAMGQPDRGERGDGRYRVARSAWHHGAAPCRETEHRPSRPGRSDCNGRWRAVHRVNGRQSLPGVRLAKWQGTVGDRRLERRGNANPITYLGRNGKQYVAVVATDTLKVFALPDRQ